MKLLVDLVVLRLRPWSQIEVRLVIAVVSERAVHPSFTLLLAQSLENTKKSDSGLLTDSSACYFELKCYIIKRLIFLDIEPEWFSRFMVKIKSEVDLAPRWTSVQFILI